jgi:phosphoserine phosphatase
MNFDAIVTGNVEENTIKQIAQIVDSKQIETLGQGDAVKIIGAKKNILPADIKADIFFVPQNNKPFKLLICDMESTIVDNEFLDEIADYLGIGEKVADITARAMNGELNFEEALKERINLINGLSLIEAKTILRTRLKYNPGAKEMVRKCKEQGIYTALVSGGFTMFTEAVKEELGFDEHRANTLVFDNEKLTGVTEPILGKEAKLEYLQNQCTKMGIDAAQVIAMGDGANDLPMLHAAGLGVAYVAKPKVKAEIFSRIDSGNLASLLAAL